MFFVFKQKTAYEMRISDWSSDVCSSDLTAQLSGSTTATNIPGQNVIALNLPLTAANALDVWRPFDGTNRTSEAVIRSLYRNNSENTNYNTFNQMKLDLNGSLFSLPAGKLKIAGGGEYLWYEQTKKINGYNNTGSTTTGTNFRAPTYHHAVKSTYAKHLIHVAPT